MLLTSLALLIIGKFCDNYDEYSDVSNVCYKINNNLHEDVFKIFIIIIRMTKKLTKKPSITVGSIGLTEDFIETFKGKESKPTDILGLLESLYEDEYDVVAIGRALISNPDWVSLVKNEDYDKIKIFSSSYLIDGNSPS